MFRQNFVQYAGVEYSKNEMFRRKILHYRTWQLLTMRLVNMVLDNYIIIIINWRFIIERYICHNKTCC